MKIALRCLLLLFVLQVSAQNTFEKGYYIDSKGLKVDGYLRVDNIEAINSNGGQIEFRSEPTGPIAKIAPEQMTEFGVEGKLKFQKKRVALDDIDLYNLRLSQFSDFELKPATVFLNVIVEGAASLYYYPSTTGDKYFVSVQGKQPEITQLLYKKYLSAGNFENENAAFRQQLFNLVKTEDQTIKDYLSLPYKRKELTDIISAYNQSLHSPSLVFNEQKNAKTKVRYVMIAGVYNSKLSVFDFEHDPDPESKINAGLSAELEFLMPSRKSALFLRVEYEKVKINLHSRYSISNNTYQINGNYAFDYSALNFIVGPRIYFNESSKLHKIYLDLGGLLFINNGSLTDSSTLTNSAGEVFPYKSEKFEVKNGFCLTAGLGYLFNSKFGVDFRVDTSKNLALFSVEKQHKTKFERIGINFRYILN